MHSVKFCHRSDKSCHKKNNSSIDLCNKSSFLIRTNILYDNKTNGAILRSSGGVMSYGVRGPGFEPGSDHCTVISEILHLLLLSRDMTEILLKWRKPPFNNTARLKQTNHIWSGIYKFIIISLLLLVKWLIFKLPRFYFKQQFAFFFFLKTSVSKVACTSLSIVKLHNDAEWRPHIFCSNKSCFWEYEQMSTEYR